MPRKADLLLVLLALAAVALSFMTESALLQWALLAVALVLMLPATIRQLRRLMRHGE